MGFFPFLAPLSPWVTQVMQDREANPVSSMLQRQPFAILTSPALVVKGGPDVYTSDTNKRADAVKTLIKKPSAEAYKGCIIASNINSTELSYSTGLTPVGIDFTGKVITVENETGRRVSTPIIESIDIDTDGANNTLKVAKVKVRCFTLKQLEMFELFFMKPGMNLIVEFGDSTLKYPNFNKVKAGESVTGKKLYQNGQSKEVTAFKDIKDALIPKVNYEDFCGVSGSFYKYFRSDSNGQQDYINRVESSLGSFDLVAGKVTDYNFSVEDNGTYNVDIEISQGNQLSLATAHSKPNKTSKTTVPPKSIEFTDFDAIKELIVSDFNLDSETFGKLLTANLPNHKDKKGWDLDLFNFLKINKEQQDTVASSDAYISLRFILKILMNYIVDTNIDKEFFKLMIPTYEVDGKNIEMIPVVSHKSIISSSDQILFPRNNIPTIIGPTPPKKKGSKTAVKNEEKLTISKIDGRIGKLLDFHIDTDITKNITGEKSILIRSDLNDASSDDVLGNALNIFIKYETVVKNWRATYTRMDFLEKILSVVNSHGYGLYNLIFGIPNENGQPSVFDHRFAPQKVITESEAQSYRFKPTTINSIVKEFSFNFEMTNLVAGRTIFNSGKFLALAKSEQTGSTLDQLNLPSAAYKSIDNSTFGNADGWYSINTVELKRIEENFTKAKEAEKEKKQVKTEDQKPEETTKEEQDLSAIIKSKSVNFLIDENDPNGKGRKVVLIYKDPTLIRNQITIKKGDVNKPTVSPITVTITVDGFSGFRCGQYFNVDGIPEIYNKIGVFQITNTKHTIDKDGWKTTIEAEHRIITKK